MRSGHPKDKWNRRYRAHTGTPKPARVLLENLHLLPKTGLALDLACGLGANALLLAEQGLRVQAWDISEVAVEKLCSRAASYGDRVEPIVRDAVADPPAAGRFDVILVSHFLERGLVPSLIRALRPGGIIYYQTFTRATVSDTGPSNPAYRLLENELLTMFSGLLIRVYREEGRLGDTRIGARDIAMLVAEKPAIARPVS